MCLILFGPPGSGKGTQAQLLKEALNVPHISTGEILRERVASKDEVGERVAAIMQSGALVPDETVNQIVIDRVAQPDCAQGFILDGYPRTAAQAKLLSELLAGRGIDPVVVHLKVDYNVIVARLAGRRQCPTCGTLYNQAPDAPALTACNRDGTKLVVREDDRPEVVRERLLAYERQTAPVLDVLRAAGYQMCEVDGGSGAAPVIAKRILETIDTPTRNAA